MKIFRVLILFLGLGFTSLAQNRTDFQTWYGSSLKLNLKKGWEVSGQYRLRLIENSSYYKGSYFFGQIDKSFNKHFLVFVNYRLALTDNGVFNRFAAAFEAKKKVNHFTIAFRPMFQYQKQQFNGDDEFKTDTDAYLRPRLTIKRPITKKLDAYIYAEPFINADPNAKIDWWQNSAGIKYEFIKNIKANLYYIWQPDYSHKKYTQTNHIIGLDLEFTIKP